MKLKILIVMMISSIASMTFYSKDAGAAEGVTPYFQVRLWAGYDKISKEFTGSPNTGQIVVNSSGKDDTDFTMGLPITGTARLGLNGEMNNVKGNVELGLSGTSVSLRHLYATYDLGPANLLVGHTVTPYTNTSGNNVADDESGNWDVGTYDSRQPQIKLTFAKMFYIDFVKPYVPSGATSNAYIVSSTYMDQVLPKMAAGLSIPAGPATIGLHFVYQQYTISKENLTSGTAFTLDGKKVSGMMVPVSAKVSIDPISINVNGYWGKNAGVLGLLSFCDVAPNVVGSSIKDNTSMGSRLDFSFKTGIGKLNGGFAYEKSKDDVSGAKDDVTVSYFVNFMYNLEKNLYIAPAWWRVDQKKSGTGVKQGTFDKLGLKFEAVF